MFDYSGCVYPTGLVQDQVLYFNQENIDKVLFNGFIDEDENRFQEIYKEWKQTKANTIKKGIIDKPLDFSSILLPIILWIINKEGNLIGNNIGSEIVMLSLAGILPFTAVLFLWENNLIRWLGVVSLHQNNK